MKPRNIVLIGFMGTGKSTVGTILADKLGWLYVDTDTQIVEKAGMSIPEIFAKQGESAFRELESGVITELLRRDRQVISTGGGAVLATVNRERMLEGGLVVALTASMEAIVERVRHDENRPLLQGDVEERVASLLESRRGAYDFAHVMLDTEHMTPLEAADWIMRQMSKEALT